MKTKLDVGYNGTLDELKQILVFDNITSVYTGGMRTPVPGGRNQYLDSLEGVSSQTDYAHSKGVEVNLALNASCNIPAFIEKAWWKKTYVYLTAIQAAGVDGVIVSHPLLLEFIKANFNLKVVVSSIADITESRTALRYEELGADVIIPSPDINMNLRALKNIRGALTRANFRLMVNEHCLPACPYKRFHFNQLAHYGPEDDYFTRCYQERLMHPERLLSGNVIRPEDLDLYAELDAEIKIVSRITSVEDTLKMVRAYTDKKYSGNFMDLASGFLSHVMYIENENLAGLGQKKLSCEKTCHCCDYCRELCRRELKLPSGKSPETASFK